MLGRFTIFAIDTEQKIFRDDVKTLKVSNPVDFMSPPFLRLNSNDQLAINFDIISPSHEYLRYRILHCNYDWQPSLYNESDYLDGFNDFIIDDFAYSENTFINYVNYNIIISPQSLNLIKSGNYLLQIFPESQPDEIILQVRFSVSEEAVPVTAGLTTQTIKGANTGYQQLLISANLSDISNLNPYLDSKLQIEQNNDFHSLKNVQNPLRVESNKVIYEHLGDLVFEAGNEFRRFETVRTDYAGLNVDSVKFIDKLWHAWIKTDTPKADGEYNYDSTQRGRFKIHEYNSTDPNLAADYIMVHFTLETEELLEGEIYIDGEFTQHQLTNNYKLRYNPGEKAYKLDLPLKQGSYNYRYVFVPKDKNGSYNLIDGNKYETQNEYFIKLFFRQPGSKGDRLIGTAHIL